MKNFHLHLISDSTGETVSSVARAALAQFEDVEVEEHMWTLVRSKSQMEKVMTGVTEHPGIVLYTLVDMQLRDMLRNECLRRNIPCIPVLSQVVAEMSSYFGEKTKALVGKQHELNEDYFSRVEAINYALAHDDGQGGWELGEADIIIVGVSRTSKSPTCMYLAYRGYKTANVPFVLDCPLPAGLETQKKPLIVGLTINPERLLAIRKTRLQTLKQEKGTNYIDMEYMQREIAESRKLFSKHRWPVIDVTKRSVEETAATIIQYYNRHTQHHTVVADDAESK